MDKKILKRKIDSAFYDFSYDFENQDVLLNFENENYIPIEFDKILNHLINDVNEKFIELRYGNYNAELSQDNFNKKCGQIIDNCQKTSDNSGVINTYISLGCIKYDENIAPCIFVPILIQRHQNYYKIYRNFNQEIQLNMLLRLVLKEDYGISLPDWNGNLLDFINKLNNIENIEYRKYAFISNFDLRFNNVFNDLDFNKWDSLKDKYELYFNNDGMHDYQEINEFKKNLSNYSQNLKINDDYLNLKTLLTMGNSILVIAEKPIRNVIKNNFLMIDMESILLEISEDLSKEEFYEVILDNNLNQNAEVINLNSLVNEYKVLSNIVDLINKDYTFLSPKQIKKNREHYLNRIKQLSIDNYEIDMKNVLDYDQSTCKLMEHQIKRLCSEKDNHFKWYNYFSIDNLNSYNFNNLINLSERLESHLDHFLKFNFYLNKRFGIKIFDNLFSIDVLNNIEVLDNDVKFIPEEDFTELNQYIMEYIENSSTNKFKRYSDSKDAISLIDNDIKYTELINKEVVSETSIDLIKEDFSNALTQINYFIDYSNYLIKQFLYIFDFYNQFNFFKIDQNLLDLSNSFDDLKRLREYFKKDLKKLLDFRKYLTSNVLNKDVERFIEFVVENKFIEKEIDPVFWFNIYDSLLKRFLDNNKNIDESKLLDEYDDELKNIKRILEVNNQQLLLQKIYSKPIELNNSQEVLNQKSNLVKNYPDKDIKSIKDSLSKYKEFITANKRIFLMDIASVSQFLDNCYESFFDYVIMTYDLKYNLDLVSLLLRSKNKVIFIKGDKNE